MEASLATVQEGETHTLWVTSTNLVPAQAASVLKHQIVPGIHIMFPPTIGTKEPVSETTNLYEPPAVDLLDKCVITPGDDAANPFVVNTAQPTKVTIDQSSTYDVACQTQLCYTIAFNSLDNIQPTQFKILLKNLVNPESVAPAAKIKIRTMLRYPESTEEKDKDYYFIDEATFDSSFIATKGTITGMNTLETARFTYKNNQAYELTFVPSHDV